MQYFTGGYREFPEGTALPTDRLTAVRPQSFKISSRFRQINAALV
jgi:hypothetical protein